MASKTFNLSMPEELLKELDKQVKKSYSSRSGYIRRAVINEIQRQARIEAIFARANAKGRATGITSEQQVYDIIEGKKKH